MGVQQDAGFGVTRDDKRPDVGACCLDAMMTQYPVMRPSSQMNPDENINIFANKSQVRDFTGSGVSANNRKKVTTTMKRPDCLEDNKLVT